MGSHLFDDPVLSASFAVAIVSSVIEIAATVLRFVATKKSQRKLGGEDYLALLALIFALGFNAMDIYTVYLLDGVNILGISELPLPRIVKVLKVGYFQDFMFPFNQVFSKLSLLVLYQRIFSSSRGFRNVVRAVGAVVIAWGISMFFTRVFKCVPVWAFWEPLARAEAQCINAQLILVIPGIFNALVDFIMVGMAVFMVNRLQVSRQNKWRLNFVFVCGGLSGVVEIIKMGDAYSSVGQSGLDGIWDMIQMLTSIICCCTPIYRVLLPKTSIFDSLRLALRSFTGSRSRLISTRKSSTSKGFEVDSRGKQGVVGPRDTWVPLDDSTHELAWNVEAGNSPRDWSTDRPHQQTSIPGAPIQVQVDKTFQVV
ncbi:hypothetical protein F4780DRAFT_188142 [Xylariomycetidae sp. FL0641]|nr:hypothetical protein F4780DRAFT_188142 [Xylariomycetidae sp. FL0641]